MFTVDLTFEDAYGRRTKRSYHHTGTLIATVLTDLTTMYARYDDIGDGAIICADIRQRDESSAVAAVAGANVDENASVQVTGGDGYKYDHNIPMPNAGILLTNGDVDIADTNLALWIDQFASGSNWRINLRNPTDIVEVNGGQLDK